MGTAGNGITMLSSGEALTFLATRSMGRLALVVNEEPHIFPVNFVIHEMTVYVRSGEGTKLIAVAVGRQAAFQVDEVTDLGATSVVVRGYPRITTTETEHKLVDSLGLHPWVPNRKTNLIALDIREIHGKMFEFGPESPDASLDPTD